MNKRIARRDFLKLASALSLGLFIKPDTVRLIDQANRKNSELPNVYIFLFDTFSARHLSLYGYKRNTTPNLARFAKRTNVYHRHYAGGNFTTPGTASLLTGSLPWTHRALGQAGLISKELSDNNLFKFIGNSYYRAGFAQNLWADILLEQFEGSLDRHFNPTDFSLMSNTTYSNRLSSDNSLDIFRGFDEFLFQNIERPSSLFFSFLKDFDFAFKYKKARDKFETLYPHGIPNLIKYNIFFLLEQVFDGIIVQIEQIKKPAFAYFHLYSPHDPYYPRQEFVDIFDDNWVPISKPTHPLVPVSRSDDELNLLRRRYDEYIANVDAEFGRLLDFLDRSGNLDDSYVVVTSDHGQSFERGLHGHNTPLLYDSVIKIPLIISSPGQTNRNDFYIPTSCVDVLPTLLKVAGRSSDGWGEGSLLPGLGGTESKDRSVFSIEARTNLIHAPLTKATVAMIKGTHKLIWHGDYPNYQNVYELYNIEEDPEELKNLYDIKKPLSLSLQNELQENLNKHDKYAHPK